MLSWPLLRENLDWFVGNGNSIHCWKDSWILIVGSLASYILAHANLSLDWSFSEMVLQDGSWNLDLFRLWLLEYIVWYIQNERNLYGDKSNVHISSPLSTLSENMLHLFTDGAIERGSGAAPTGGVLLDQNRNWIFGYN
ncbi:hypothetical protein J1N35_026501 [Gossypium stocksii]|uniref:Reverse transcriptase zinc-binding domain-containing protein n=1 Tax=Gossypium stocksii TaxID=47602 RepID=A0A9D3VAQ4_9ROSI|nr:hypothetical protein J1N35_026501 [Gossypium stocksii]